MLRDAILREGDKLSRPLETLPALLKMDRRKQGYEIRRFRRKGRRQREVRQRNLRVV